MKRYKLLKDLPRAKAGEIVIITNVHSNTACILKINKWDKNESQRPRLAYIHTKNVDEWLEEIPEKPKSVWDLKVWDEYYTIYKYNICKMCVTDSKYFEIDYINPWHVFLTQKEAEQELEKRKAIQRIKKYCFENNLNTEYRTWRTEICATRFWEIKLRSVENYFVPNPIWYFHENTAKKILEKFEKELKIIFNV